jgi:iron complex transport system substrate-binding protein
MYEKRYCYFQWIFFVISGLSLMMYCFSARAEGYPRRIVSLGPLNTENLYLLGAEDRLVGNTSYCVRPESAKEIEKIGSVMQVSVEKIISLHPDLVLATGLTQPRQIKKLENIGIRVVRFNQPVSFIEICELFLHLGHLLGLEDRAQQIVVQARSVVESLQKNISGLPRTKVFLQVGSQPLFSSVKSSFTHDYIVLAGGINIAGDQTTGNISYEKVIAENPDVIIIAMMGSETGVAAKEKQNWQRFTVINAVRNERIHIVNPDLVCSPSPTTFAETLGLIVGLIHPESTLKTVE